MAIWILAIFLLAVFGAIGYWRGAIRVLVSWAGLVLALLFTDSLAPQVRPVFPMLGLEHPLWNGLLALIVSFFIIILLWKIVVYLVQQKVDSYYQYRTDEIQRIRWQLFNSRIGACLALVTGTVYLSLVGIAIYVGGHLSTQVTGTDTPVYLRVLNQARNDLRTTGFERLVAAIEPMPEKYYNAANAIGLIYHNPSAHKRLAAYPQFLTFREKEPFQKLISNSTLMGALRAQGNPIKILSQPEVVTILQDDNLMAQLKSVDYEDLQSYLKTGDSPKYQDQPILGIWKFNAIASANRLRQQPPRVKLVEFHRIRRFLTARFHGMKLIVTTENEAFFKFQPTDRLKRFAQRLAEMDESFNNPKLEPFTHQGSWSGQKGSYKMQVEGQTTSVSIEADGNRLVLKNGALTNEAWPFAFFRVW